MEYAIFSLPIHNYFLNSETFRRLVRLPWKGIGPSQSLYLHRATQEKCAATPQSEFEQSKAVYAYTT
jgi:hypothetical protein